MYIFTSFLELQGFTFQSWLAQVAPTIAQVYFLRLIVCDFLATTSSILSWNHFVFYQYEWQGNALSKTSTNCWLERKLPKHLSSSYLSPFLSPSCCLQHHWIISAKNPNTVGKQTPLWIEHTVVVFANFISEESLPFLNTAHIGWESSLGLASYHYIR